MADGHSTVRYRGVEEFLEGFSGYRVGDDGSVWNAWINCRWGRRLTDRWKPMKLGLNSRGYLSVNLTPTGGGKYKTFRVHRLVLQAFVGPCPEGMEGRHLDGDKANAALRDAEGKIRLAWGSPEENRQDNRDLGAYQGGEGHTQAKATEEIVREIRRKYAAGDVLLRDLATEFGLALPTVHAIVRRQTWRHIA